MSQSDKRQPFHRICKAYKSSCSWTGRFQRDWISAEAVIKIITSEFNREKMKVSPGNSSSSSGVPYHVQSTFMKLMMTSELTAVQLHDSTNNMDDFDDLFGFITTCPLVRHSDRRDSNRKVGVCERSQIDALIVSENLEAIERKSNKRNYLKRLKNAISGV